MRERVVGCGHGEAAALSVEGLYLFFLIRDLRLCSGGAA